MIDPTYVSQALAWLAVWSAAGVAGRQYLASKEAARHTAPPPAPTRKIER